MEMREKFGKLISLKDVGNGKHRRNDFNNLDIYCNISNSKITGSVFPARYFDDNHFEIKNVGDFEKFEWSLLNAKLQRIQEEKEKITTQMCLDESIWERKRTRVGALLAQPVLAKVMQHFAKNITRFPETLLGILKTINKYQCKIDIKCTPDLIKQICYKDKKNQVEALGAALALDNSTTKWDVLFSETERYVRWCIKPSDIKRIHQISRNTAACHSLKKLLMD